MTDNLFADARVLELLGGGFASTIARVFRQVEIAEEEIATARGTSEQDQADPVWNAFPLLRATHDLMASEFIYRAHVRELLDRVSKGHDTRPATDAEIAVNVSEASLSTPLHGRAVGLQMRLFARAFPDKFAQLGFDLDQYERMYGREIDELESDFRRKLRHDWRLAETPKAQHALFEEAA
jgi:hypothetical protein